MDVPNEDVKALLGAIGAVNATHEPSPVQEIQIVAPVNTLTRKNVSTPIKEDRPPIGKPTLKQPGVAYARLSPRIPVAVKKQLDIALVNGGYQDEDGQPIRYIDEFVAEAVRRMLATRPVGA